MLKKLASLEDNFTITKAAVIVGLLTLLTKFLAIYRERLFGATFGQDRILDTYFSAFRVPDFITNVFILSTLSVAFLPIFTELLTKDRQRALQVANTVLNWICLIIGALCLVLLAVSTPLTKILVPGFSPEYFQNTLNLTRLFLISPLIFAVSTVMGGYLNSHKKFLITSLAPILYNLGIISGVIFLYPRFGIQGLGYGVICGAAAQLLIQIWYSLRNGYAWRLNFKITGDVKKIISLYLPRLLAFDLSNITLLLGTILGSYLVEGSIASLNQAYNLQAVPVGVFAFALALAAFTPLSEYYAVGNEKKFALTLLKVLRQIMFFMVPMTVLMLLYRAYIVRLVLGFGKFSWDDTVRTLTVLGIFSFSLLTQSLTTILSRAFFARQNTKIPVAINVLCLGVNLVAGMFLAEWPGRDGQPLGIYGLAAAFVLASSVNALLLFAVMRKTLAKVLQSALPGLLIRFEKELWVTLLKIILASVAMGLICYLLIYLLGNSNLIKTNTVIGIFLQSGISGAAGIITFLATGHYLRLEETKIAVDFLRKFLYTFNSNKTSVEEAKR